MQEALLSRERRNFHKEVLQNVLRVTKDGNPNNADKDSGLSVKIAAHILNSIGKAPTSPLPGQSAGSLFEQCCEHFLNSTFPKLGI